jgi:hypothetical protein
MTLPAWLERASPGHLDLFLGRTASSRKRGIFIRHLCLSNPEAFADARSLAAIDAADRYEAGETDEPVYQAAVQAAVRAADDAQNRLLVVSNTHVGLQPTSYGAAHFAMTAAQIASKVASQGYYKRVMADLMRVVGASTCPRSTSRKRAAHAIRILFLEHFGDIQRPVALEPSWRTEAVMGLASGIYAERAFDHMPILGDALEDAGCTTAEILDHLRSPGPHIRGCWAVDLVLGK